jgi:hypothetical protein
VTLSLRQLPKPHWVVKLPRIDDAVLLTKDLVPQDSLWSLSLTGGEVSLVSTLDFVPGHSGQEGPWTVFEVAGPLDFSLVGIIATLTTPLQEAGVPVFVVSTFTTDYLMVSTVNSPRAVSSWRECSVSVQVLPDERSQ